MNGVLPTTKLSKAVKRDDDSYGHIATRFIKKDELICSVPYNKTQSHATKYSVQIGVNEHFDCPSPLMYTNHACVPSARIDLNRTPNSLDLMATRDIPVGDEITFCYLTTEYKMATPFLCGCGHDECHGKIQGYYHAKNKSQLPDDHISPAVKELARNIICNDQ
ncbi:uncharacterized protein LOC141904155 [Tubulanus polymorphus]|uniref:uncharacterized protein LOC141904155 n=1 Tax=Tubulanus polymorphus TaxID=672921 RepID=UPI003DA42EE4